MAETRSHAERLAIAETLLSSVWDEIQDGKVEYGALQPAVNAQIMCNRIVWKLNEATNGGQHDGYGKVADAIERLVRELYAMLGTHPDPKGELGDPGILREPPK